MPKHCLLLFVIAVWMMTGCASGGRRTPMMIPASMPSLPVCLPRPMPPAALTQGCEALPPPTGAGLPELLANHLAVARRYHECRDRQMGLADWVLTNE